MLRYRVDGPIAKLLTLLRMLVRRFDEVEVDRISEMESPWPDLLQAVQAIQQLAAEHDKMNHDDPCHAIPMIQKVYQIAGMPLPERAREAISRLDAGEDIDAVDAEFGDLWFSEDSPFAEGAPLHHHFAAMAAPRVDETLYEL